MIKATLVLLVTRIALLVLPFQKIWQIFSSFSSSFNTSSKTKLPTIEQIVWVVETMSNFIPATKNCLVKSLAIKILLAMHNYDSILKIGVTKTKQDKINAHAWIKCKKEGIISGEVENIADFVLLH